MFHSVPAHVRTWPRRTWTRTRRTRTWRTWTGPRWTWTGRTWNSLGGGRRHSLPGPARYARAGPVPARLAPRSRVAPGDEKAERHRRSAFTATATRLRDTK